jgi:hypothetical protein
MFEALFRVVFQVETDEQGQRAFPISCTSSTKCSSHHSPCPNYSWTINFLTIITFYDILTSM